MNKVELHPDVFTIEAFLSDTECSEWVTKADSIDFEEAMIQVGDGRQVINKQVRNNERHLFFDEHLAHALWLRLKPHFPDRIGVNTPIGLNEMFRVYKYTKGQRFKMHKDGSYIRNENEYSLYSLVIYLNANFRGGQTSFRKLFSVIPEQGKALLFAHPLRHEGKEITEGTKYVLRTDVMFKDNSL